LSGFTSCRSGTVLSCDDACLQCERRCSCALERLHCHGKDPAAGWGAAAAWFPHPPSQHVRRVSCPDDSARHLGLGFGAPYSIEPCSALATLADLYTMQHQAGVTCTTQPSSEVSVYNGTTAFPKVCTTHLQHSQRVPVPIEAQAICPRRVRSGAGRSSAIIRIVCGKL
jgi:hypothetical protein